MFMGRKEINVQFGNVLRKIREGRSMTQEEFAALCDISRAYYGRLERGEHSVTLDLCQKITEATGIALSEMFEDIQ
jgi:transcriptional regulator with XRE-family HTH domain